MAALHEQLRNPTRWSALRQHVMGVLGILVAGNTAADTRIEDEKAVEKQAEIAHTQDSIWAHVKAADLAAVRDTLRADPSLLASRGPVGETLLHVCYLHNTPEHKKIARYLLCLDPELITSVYLGAPYRGENALHMAIANKDEEEARFLVARCPALIAGRATGTFFDRRGTAYYGELPLSFAAVTNQANFVTFLVAECGASIADQDSYGNTAAHLCVIHKRLDMYSLLEALWEKGFGRPPHLAHAPLSSITNKDGHTPLVLAASLNMPDVFRELWTRGRKVEWCWGAVTAYLYPLDGVDDISELLQQSANAHGDPALPLRKVTAIETAVRSGWSSVLMDDLMLRLLDYKWSRFAGRMFMRRMWRTMGFLCLLATTTILRTSGWSVRDMMQAQSFGVDDVFSEWEGPLALVGQAVVAAICARACIDGLRRIFHTGISGVLHDRGASMLEHTVPLVASASVLVAFGLEATVMSPFARILMGVGTLFWWLHMLWFMLGFRLTGPFVLMIVHMLIQDVLRFFILNVIFILAFAHGTFILAGDVGLEPFLFRMRQSVATMLSPELPESVSTLEAALPAAYVIFSSVMLLNLLVAMMGDTYGRITENADREWQLERARIILSLESTMPVRERLDDRNKYWAVMQNRAYLMVEEKDDAVFANEERNSAVREAREKVLAGVPQTDGSSRAMTPSKLQHFADVAVAAMLSPRTQKPAGPILIAAAPRGDSETPAGDGISTAHGAALARRTKRRLSAAAATVAASTLSDGARGTSDPASEAAELDPRDGALPGAAGAGSIAPARARSSRRPRAR